MSLCEEFDQPVQDYGRYSNTGLATVALYRLSHCGFDQNSETAAKLGHDAFRLTSWVDEEDSLFGNALAISRPNEDGDTFMSAQLYKVNRDERQILPEYPKAIEVPRPIVGIRDLKSQEIQEWASDLTIDFGRDELEVSLHMLTKAAAIFYSSRLPAFDKYVYYALADSEADELSQRFPGRQEMSIPPDSTPEHILEWRDFMSLAHDRMDRELGGEQKPQEIFLQHEVGAEHYALNICRREGQLVSIQILKYTQGTWQGQFVELALDQDEDDFTVGEVSPVWNRDEILEVIRDGKLMSPDVYEAYLREAARNLGQTNNFALSNVFCLENAKQKRPAQ